MSSNKGVLFLSDSGAHHVGVWSDTNFNVVDKAFVLSWYRVKKERKHGINVYKSRFYWKCRKSTFNYQQRKQSTFTTYQYFCSLRLIFFFFSHSLTFNEWRKVFFLLSYLSSSSSFQYDKNKQILSWCWVKNSRYI